MLGSEHNDVFEPDDSGVSAREQIDQGYQGGISNGMPVTVRVAFKPVATIFQNQDTVGTDGEATTIKPRGRHDPCVVPRAVPMVEAMMAIVILDHALRQRAQCGG